MLNTRTTPLWIVTCSTMLISSTNAQWWGGNGNGNGGRPPWWDGSNDGDDNTAPSFGALSFFNGSESSGYRALIAHAVIASAVWVVLIPAGGILLRLNIRSPWVLRVHIALQALSYLLYIAAAGLGIYLINNTSPGGINSLWRDSHPRLGLAILALATFQPILGVIHHRMFKKRVANVKEGKPGPVPGRTVPGHMHLWLGRILIVLGIVNGGQGIRLANQTPFQSSSTTRTAAIVYGVIAGVIFLIYVAIAFRFERQKLERDQKVESPRETGMDMDDIPPTYVESQESAQKAHRVMTRYS